MLSSSVIQEAIAKNSAEQSASKPVPVPPVAWYMKDGDGNTTYHFSLLALPKSAREALRDLPTEVIRTSTYMPKGPRTRAITQINSETRYEEPVTLQTQTIRLKRTQVGSERYPTAIILSATVENPSPSAEKEKEVYLQNEYTEMCNRAGVPMERRTFPR